MILARAHSSKFFLSAGRRVVLILPWGEITNSFYPAIISEAVSSKFQFFSEHQKIYYIASAMMGTYTLFKFGKNMNLELMKYLMNIKRALQYRKAFLNAIK
jgi:hypothetical protein